MELCLNVISFASASTLLSGSESALRLWIDILTPKQARFFEPLARDFERAGHTVMVTTRQYREAAAMLDLLRLQAHVVGAHGGALPRNKLRASLERTQLLEEMVGAFDADVVLSFSSPEASRIAFGLSLPHVCVNDSPHADAVARLSVSLATRLATPWIIPKSAWTRFGISPRRVTTYRALDPAAWLKRRRGTPSTSTPMESMPPAPFFVFRPTETAAAYLPGPAADELGHSYIDALLRAFPDYRLLVLPRYEDARGWRDRHSSPRVLIAERLIDTVGILPGAAAFIGMGGTMTAEASLLGVPSLSAFPGKSFHVERYLMRMGLLRRVRSPQEALPMLSRLLQPAQRHGLHMRAARLLNWMEDPLTKVAGLLRAVARKR